MVTEFFCLHTIGDGMFLIATSLTTENFFVANCVAIEFFFNRHMFVDLGFLIDDGLISTIDLETKFDLFNNKM